MNCWKKIFLCCLILVAASFGEEAFKASNVCDTLPFGASPVVELKLAYVDETIWHGNKDLQAVDSQKVVRHESYNDLYPQRSNFPYGFPYSVKAGCSVKKNVTYYYGEWNTNTKKWSLNDENNDYATSIMDIHGNKTSDYDSTNSFNLLAVRQNSLPEDGSYAAGELLVSKTYELAFNWWYASAVYKYDSTYQKQEGEKTVTYKATRYFIGQSVGMDSLKVVNRARASLNIPDSIQKVDLQVFHAVLVDSRKMQQALQSSSSESPVVSSSSSEVPAVSSSSVQPVMSSSSVQPVVSSSSVQPASSSSSGSPAVSSSSEQPAESSSSSKREDSSSSSKRDDSSSSSQRVDVSSSSVKPVESSSSSSEVPAVSSSSAQPATSSSSVQPVVSSSSEQPAVSSSSESPAASSSSVQPAESSSSSKREDSSSSSKRDDSSSSSKSDAIVRTIADGARPFVASQVRRLDGSLVKSSETLTPGVYYVRDVDGQWKRKMVKQRQ